MIEQEEVGVDLYIEGKDEKAIRWNVLFGWMLAT